MSDLDYQYINRRITFKDARNMHKQSHGNSDLELEEILPANYGAKLCCEQVCAFISYGVLFGVCVGYAVSTSDEMKALCTP